MELTDLCNNPLFIIGACTGAVMPYIILAQTKNNYIESRGYWKCLPKNKQEELGKPTLLKSLKGTIKEFFYLPLEIIGKGEKFQKTVRENNKYKIEEGKN